MTIHHVRDNALLQLIAATLSLLLLAGMFGSEPDTDEANSAEPAENVAANTREYDFDDTL